jgi:hypothetical protein
MTSENLKPVQGSSAAFLKNQQEMLAWSHVPPGGGEEQASAAISATTTPTLNKGSFWVYTTHSIKNLQPL